jgi:hypothetical protein
MAEQVAGDTVPDVLALQDDPNDADADDRRGGLAVATVPPRTAIHDLLIESRALTALQRRLTIRHSSGDRVVALLEIVSPGNKASQDGIDRFISKAAAALNHGYHLLLIDLFPPGTFDPEGIHGLLWSYLGSTYSQPAGLPLTLAAYASGELKGVECYVEPTAVGSRLIEMPIFLTAERYVNVPLEQTYLAAYEGVPKRWKRVIEG